MNISLSELFVLMGVPTAITSAVVGLCVWALQRTLAKKDEQRQKKIEEREKARTEVELSTVASVYASLDLGIATAAAVQRIPDAHCNGDMHEALERAKGIQDSQRDLFVKLGIAATLQKEA